MYFIEGCFTKFIDDDLIAFNPVNFSVAIFPGFRMSFKKSKIDELTVHDYFINYCKSHQYDVDLLMAPEEQSEIARFFSNRIKYQNQLTIGDIPSYKCNLNCVYCFENHFSLNDKPLPFELRFQLISDIIDCYRSSISAIDYIFFGGEPLLNDEYIESTCIELSKKFPDKKINYSCTTNGTILTDRFIQTINDFQFTEIRVTLDGPKLVHDSRRRTSNEQGGFVQILDNLKRICVETDVNILINTVLDTENQSVYLDMINMLSERFSDYMFGNKARFIFNIGYTCAPMIQTEHTKTQMKCEESIHSHYYFLAEQLLKKGLTITQPFYSTHCLNSSEKAFMIDPLGDIYKCITGVHSDHFLLSSYRDFYSNPQGFLKANIHHIENAHQSKCGNCKFLMMCNGGCKFQKETHNQEVCRYSLLNNEMDSLLNLLYIGEINDEDYFQQRI